MRAGRLTVYVQNDARRDAAYTIDLARWRAAVSVPADELDLRLHDVLAPDLAALAAADVYVGSGFDTGLLRAHGRRLKLVHVTSAGVEKYLPLDWLPPGASFTNSRGIHAHKAYQYALMALLMLATRMPACVNAQRAQAWQPVLTPCTDGQHVVIVGMGNLGQAVARAARVLGLRVTAVTRSGCSGADVDQLVASAQLGTVLPDADFVVLCCPLTSATRGLLSAHALQRMKPGAGLVNMARGAVVDTAALLAALQTGRLGGAVLDVFDEEPLPPTSAVWQTPKLIVTPHISCDEPAGYIEKALGSLGRNLHRLLRGERPDCNVVSAEHQY